MNETVRRFESTFAKKLGVGEAIATNSGTSALIAVLASLDLRRDDEVITTPYTFIATANAIVHAGATPVFADILPDSLLIDPADIERKCSRRTRAIIPVHLFGQVCDMAAIIDIARHRDLFVVEDTAQALGARLDGRYAGTLGDAGTFSFYRSKNLSTFEGGMIALPEGSRLDAVVIRALVSQGDSGGRSYEHVGYNFRLAEPLALLGLHHLESHWQGIVAELGRYGPKDGYYPQVVYATPAYKRRRIHGDCPVAERAAAAVRARLEQA